MSEKKGDKMTHKAIRSSRKKEARKAIVSTKKAGSKKHGQPARRPGDFGIKAIVSAIRELLNRRNVGRKNGIVNKKKGA